MSNHDFATTASPFFFQWQQAIDLDDDTTCEALIARLTLADLPAIVELYRADVDHYQENRRWWAVRALADLGGLDEIACLLDALRDPSADVRAATTHGAAQVAARLWPTDRTPSHLLLAALSGRMLDDLGFVRQTAADALAQLGEIAVPVLRSVLRTRDEGARTRAAYALGKIRSREAAADLFALLDDQNPMVRLYAQEALDDMGLLGMVYFTP